MKCKLSAILFVIFFICSCGSNEEVKTKSVKMVKCETVVSSNRNSVQRTFPGKMTATKDVNLSFRVAGVIENINVKEGQYIRKNQVVATMDKRDYQTQLDATQAEYNAIKAEVDRVIALYNDKSVSDNDYDKAINGLKAITAKLEAHTNALEDTNLKAPFDGYIQSISFNRGEAVSAGMPLISFISAATPDVKVNIPTTEYIKRDELIAATATIDLYPDKVFSLKRIGSTHKANVNHLYETIFSIEPQEGIIFTAGMSVMVTLEYENKNVNTEMVIPFASIFEKDSKSYVWLLSDGKATVREVKISDVKGDGTALISSGVKEGDLVISAGIHLLTEGQEVKPLINSSVSNVGNIL